MSFFQGGDGNLKSTNSTSNASLTSSYSADNDDTSRRVRPQLTISQDSSSGRTKEETASPSKKSDVNEESQQQQQQQQHHRKQPPPPSVPYMSAQASSTPNVPSSNNRKGRTAPARPIHVPNNSHTFCTLSSSSSSQKLHSSIPSDSQARLRASASSTCTSVVQRRPQGRFTNSGSRRPATNDQATTSGDDQNSNSSSAATVAAVSSLRNDQNNYDNNNNNNNNNNNFIIYNHHEEAEDEPILDQQHQQQTKGEWKIVSVHNIDNGNNTLPSTPCARSLHAAALWNDQFLVFGGYDGQTRRNDFYSFHLKEQRWNLIIGNGGTLPTPRDRHSAIAYGNSFYIFGGFDGRSRVNDFYEFDFTTMMWKQIIPTAGSTTPSPRHSHSVVVHMDSMYVFGGYDGSYQSDLYKYNFLLNEWVKIPPVGRSPRARYRATSVTYRDKMIIYGGHDGTRHLSDVHMFDFRNQSWTMIVDILGSPPLARDSHVCAVHGDSMFIFGGSTGTAMNDLYELRLNDGQEGCERGDFVPKWNPVITSGSVNHRFCHVGAIYGGCFYVFGGYDGSARLNDFSKFEFNFDDLSYNIPPSTLVMDMRSFVNNEMLSDVIFIVEGQSIHAHKLMLVRCNYFRAMLTGSMMESSLSTIHLEDIRAQIFLFILEYLYTDKLEIQVESAMELFAAADLFGIPRLQCMCEKELLQSINTDNAATIFHAADEFSATVLRSKSLNFILKHFEEVSKSHAFEEMARNNVELVVEILRLR